MYIFISLFILLLSIILFRQVSGSLNPAKLNMISWIFYFDLFLQAWISSLLVVSEVDGHYMIGRISDDDARYMGWLAIQYVMLALPLGMFIALLFTGNLNAKSIFLKYRKKPIRNLFSKKDLVVKYQLYVLNTVCILSVVYVIYVTGGWSGLDAVSGESSSLLSRLRYESGHGFDGNVYIKNIFAIGLTPILTYVAYLYYVVSKHKSDLIWFGFLLIATFFILTYNLEKGPIIKFILGFIFLRVLVAGSVSLKKLILMFTGMVSILLCMYVLLSDNLGFLNLSSYNTGIIGRIILSQSAGVYLSFDLFPFHVGHIGFSSLSNILSTLFDGEHSVRSAEILSANYNTQKYLNQSTGVINSLFIAEAWANFGLFGVIITPIYVGMLIQFLYLFFLKMPKTPLFMGLLVSFSYQGGINGGVNGYIYSVRPILTLLIFLTIYVIGHMASSNVKPRA